MRGPEESSSGRAVFKRRDKMKDIIFDFGGVLVEWDPRRLYRKIFDSEKEMEWFLANICTGEWNAQQDAGRPFAQGVALLKEQYPKYAKEIEMFYTRWEEMLGGEVEGMPELLGELKDRGYKLYGLTNWSAQTFPVARARFHVFDLLDGLVVSGEEKLIKPDHALFRRLLERFSLRAENCVFVDDSPANCAAARELGMSAVDFKNAEQLREALKRIGIL